VESIGTIVHQVVGDTEEAVASMERNAELTQHGLESIRRANESTTLITQSNQEMLEQILAIDTAAESIKVHSGEIADNMKQVSDNTQQNSDAVGHVSAASQENRAGAESLAEIVEQIRELSERLNQVVQG